VSLAVNYYLSRGIYSKERWSRELLHLKVEAVTVFTDAF
jgi:hypothetical protein